MLHKVWCAIVEGRFLESIFQKVGKVSKRLGKALKKLRSRIDKLLSRPFIYLLSRCTKVDNNKILFITFRGEYDCNAKWIAEEIKDSGRPFTVVWTIRENVPVDDIPEEFIRTYRTSLDFYKHLASAKIIVDNGISTVVEGYIKKKNQVLMETWHGSLGIKMFSKETNKDKKWVTSATLEGKMTDYCLSNSTFEDKVFTDTFWAKSRILQLGHARNDILCERGTERLAQIKDKVYTHFNLYEQIEKQKVARRKEIREWICDRKAFPWVSADPEHPWSSVDLDDRQAVAQLLENEVRTCEDLRICLYAPTFRDDGDMRPYELDYAQLKKALETRFGGYWVIMTRFHWRLRKKEMKLPEFVIDASKYSDIQELLTCTDVGITDYSSWICDYMLTKRPGFLFATDMVAYEKKDREFFYPLDTMPYPLAVDNDQLIDNILNFKDEHFEEECDAFLEDKGCIDDGLASKRIVDVIEKVMRGEKV